MVFHGWGHVTVLCMRNNIFVTFILLCLMEGALSAQDTVPFSVCVRGGVSDAGLLFYSNSELKALSPRVAV